LKAGAAFGSSDFVSDAACPCSPFSGQQFGQGNSSPVMGQVHARAFCALA